MKSVSWDFTVDWRKLRLLHELDRRGTIAAVADAMYLTPSAVSQQLAALAREVGAPLLERRGRSVVLTGQAGFTACWHALTLHGTQPDEGDEERISLRYLFAKAPGATDAGIDAINANLRGPARLTTTRTDLDAAGAAQVKGNSVNKV